MADADHVIVSTEYYSEGVPPFEIRNGQLSELISAIGHAGDRTRETFPPVATMCYLHFHRGGERLLTLVYCGHGIFMDKANREGRWFWNTRHEMENLIDRRILCRVQPQRPDGIVE